LVQTAAPTSSRFEWIARAISGVVMAMAAVAGVAGGGWFFTLIIAISAVAGLREWHRLINGGRPRHGVTPETSVTSLSVITGVLFIYFEHSSALPMLILVVGGGLAGIFAALRKSPVLLHAAGALYIGGPALALVALRQDHMHGGWIVLGVFIAVWATDIGALFFGRLIGGPKLAPALSPNKTWTGFWGGVIFAAVAEALYVAVLGGPVVNALIFGAFLAIVGHSGDLFESWVKRRFRAKNSGTMIPGHGGMLDRVDSLLFAAPLAAGLVFLAHFDPVAGVPW
jgi:phosphatidate cytidylyltransferase